jgi:2-keto-3-deoxy-L-rhamnonate aldolase RhmA
MSLPHGSPMVPDLRARLSAGDFLLGSWLTILDPTVTELMAGAGFDLLVADGEHGPVATSDLVQMLIATRAAGVPILYRVGANEPVRIMHALDAGAAGVIVPQVRTVADTERAVAWCRYPPVGLRGIAPRRASEYGRHTAEYLQAADDLVTCCIQIETSEALDDLDAILAVPGIDTILVGPNDLAAALGHIGDLGHADVEAAIARILARAKAHGLPAGIWTPSVAQTRSRRAEGFAWATLGADYGFLLTAAEGAVREVRGL